MFQEATWVKKSKTTLLLHPPPPFPLFLALSQSRENRFVSSSCPSVCPHVLILLTMEGFLWNFMFDSFIKNSVKIEVWLKSDAKFRALNVRKRAFCIWQQDVSGLLAFTLFYFVLRTWTLSHTRHTEMSWTVLTRGFLNITVLRLRKNAFNTDIYIYISYVFEFCVPLYLIVP